MTFIVGAFTAQYHPAGGSNASIGQTKEGFRIIETPHVVPIRTDEWGDTQVDGVHRGCDVRVELDYAEYDLVDAMLYAAHPQGTPKTNVGKLMTALSGPLVLTPVAGTTAAAESGAWTFYLCYVESDIQTLLKNGLREGPLTLRCLPSVANSNKHYNKAAAS